MNPVIEKLIAELDKAISGDPWYGPSLKTNLADVSCEQAVGKHISTIHSIAEITFHICAWIEEVSSRLEGNAPKDPERGDWKIINELSEADWLGLQQELFAAHNLLLNLVEGFPFEKFEEYVGEERNKELGTGFTYREMLVGLMEHNIYHGGQIALLKKLP